MSCVGSKAYLSREYISEARWVMSFSIRSSIPSDEARLIEDRIDSIYHTWLQADTHANRAFAAKTGVIEVNSFQPSLSQQRFLRSRYTFVPHLSYRTAGGLAALAITPHGLRIRKYRGHITKTYQWGDKPGVVNLFTTNDTITKTDPLDVVSSSLRRTFPWIYRYLIEWRVKRLIREAIYSEIAGEREEVKRIASRKLMEACTAGCAIIANADGVVTGDEKRSFLKYMTSSDLLSLYDAEEVIRSFEEHCTKYEIDPKVGEAEALKVIAPLKVDPVEARALARACSRIAAADGNFDQTERHALMRVCAEVGLDPSEYVPHG